MPYTPLDRQFRKWQSDKATDEDFRLFENSFFGDAGWSELLKFQRVVILAEAGSGKSTELEEQAKRLTQAGEFAFHTSVQAIAKHGVPSAVGAAVARLGEWLQSDRTAWFFIDSIDEAKLDHIRLNEAITRLADGLSSGRPRARIILSGRYSNWEFRTDLAQLEAALPAVATRPDLPDDPENPLIRLMRNEGRGRRKKTPLEKPQVVLMAPLDRVRVRTFAAGQGVKNLDAFVAALDAANLWSLAQRPLDLSWLVEYWRRNERFGPFADMLETSLRERLNEPNTGRARRDASDAERSFLALERIGATMIFGRENRIELPDPTLVLTPSTPGLRLRDILPDWSGEQQARLLDRPVFDPASLGRINLHNDNQGVVRGFLAARWLKRRLEGNVPVAAVRDLLFAAADGVPIVLPSVRETAAWLSIWSPDCAREVILRDPALLLTAGDPGSLSPSTRAEALKQLIARLAAGDERLGSLDQDTLRRFTTAEMVSAIQAAWELHKGNEQVRKLLLSVIEAGELKPCASIAFEAVSGAFGDRPTVLYGARALAVVAGTDEIEAFVAGQRTNLLPDNQTVLWEALDLFFPRYLSIDDFLAILALSEKAPEKAPSIEWRGRNLVERLRSRVDLERLLQGLMRQAGAGEYEDEEAETPTGKRLAAIVQITASKLIRSTSARQPNLAAIDAAIWFFRERHRLSSVLEDKDFPALLCATPERRRAGLWRAVERLKDTPRVVKWGGLANLVQLAFAGWAPGLKQEDVEWLIEDARNAPTPLHRKLALDGLLSLYRDGGSPEPLLARIREVAALDSESAALVEARLTPRQLSPEELKLNCQIARQERGRAISQKKVDQSWIEFVDGLKADPQQLRTPPPNLKTGHVDSRLYHIWRLLYDTLPDQTEYAIDEFGELGGVFGPELVREATAALIGFWRSRQPTLTSSRTPVERNQVNQFDCMGIAGVSFEAKTNPDWLSELSPEEATVAAQFSTLELNSFPIWTRPLAAVWPTEVREIFEHEARDHLATDASQHGFVDKVKYADSGLAALLVPSMVKYVADHPDLEGNTLSKALDVVARAFPVTGLSEDFIRMALERFKAAANDGDGARYLAIAFQADAALAVEALTEKLDRLDPPAQKCLVESVLPSVFGDRMFRSSIDPKVLPFAVLERLVGIAFRTIRMEEDNVHHGVYSPDQRDDAESARGHLFHQLRATPGRPTIDALKRLKNDPSCPIHTDRLAAMILERAAEDAEHAPWPASEAQQMEEQFDAQPRTPRDLQVAALRRLADIDHDLHHAAFAQGQTVKTLANEREVQKWVAHELSHRKGRAYSITREPHVVEEKEPDIRFQSNATDANMPIEIKVAERWTLPELRAALTTQLAGRYLRERDKRHGILLMVHQTARPRGWEDEAGLYRSFSEVVANLRADADRLGAGGADAAFAEIAVIDVSDIEMPPPGGRRP